MPAPPKVILLRSGNRIVVSPTTPHIRALLAPQLTYEEEHWYHGYERKKRIKAGLLPFDVITWECFSDDYRGRLATSFGFVPRITRCLTEAGYEVLPRWASPVEAEEARQRATTVYAPDWERIAEFEQHGYAFRPGQRRALEMLARFPGGRISCPPAWGKGDAIMLGCMLFTRAKIAVVTKSCSVLTQRLYPQLCLNLPSVGIVGAGMRTKRRRVMCYSADSLHHCTGDEDLVFVDEGQQACADKFAASLGKFDKARIWMYSASWDQRGDNKNIRGEAIAGPIRMRVTTAEAQADGMIAPLEVFMSNVIMDVNPCAGCSRLDEKKRNGIWTNDYRNSVIAADARRYGDDVQTLITVETIEHGLHLQRLLPEFALVYDGQALDHNRLKRFYRAGLIDEGWTPLTPEGRERLTRRYSSGALKKAIATTVWNVGVNFTALQVVIRAEGAGAGGNDTQIPGRAVRLHDDKEVAIVHDYLDQFDSGFKTKANGRIANYVKRNGWKVHLPSAASRSRLRQLMAWEEEA